jgi:hypothetical protein
MLNQQFLCLTCILAYLITHQFSSSYSAQSPFCSSYPTSATAQFAILNTIRLSFFFTSARSRFIRLDNILSSFVLSGDIEHNILILRSYIILLFSVCTLSIRPMSLTNCFHILHCSFVYCSNSFTCLR